MREIILATLLAALMVPGAVSAEMDGGAPDGATYYAPNPTDEQNTGKAGGSRDTYGNPGNEGQTAPADGGTADAATHGGESDSGAAGSSQVQP